MSDTAKKQVRKLKIIEDDPNLSAFEGDLNERVRHFKQRKKELLAPGQTLTEFASGHLYYGFHKVKGGWVYREWAPGATAMHLIGDFNNWNRTSHPMKAVGNGNWEIEIPGVRTLKHRSKVKVAVTSPRGTEDRIPLYATYVVQDEKTHNFSAAIWNPRKEFVWTDEKFRPKKNVPPLIYEAHVGMATEEERVGTYLEFMRDILPRIKKDGYNTVFMQVRPFGDSFAPSRYYPASSFVTGAYGRAFDYDPVAVLVDEAHARGLSIHAWINPYRLMKPDELRAVSTDYLLRRWLDEDRLREVDGRLYLDPSDAGARSLIINGAKELLHDYNFDGLHIDDYFYPTQSEDFDRVAFLNSGETDLAAFRESNINKLVSGLYAAVKSVDSRLLFGVSPAGNLSNLKSGYYLDVETWCSQEGYLDYILPQVYFGFLHETCAFDELTARWANVAASGSVRLYIGLTGGKAVDGRAGVEDRYAGTEAGRREWIEHTDVLKRSLECLFDTDGVDGFCFFSYQYLYDPLTGKANEALAEEYAGFAPLIRNK